MIATLITVLDLCGVAVFAVTGGLVASRKQMDIVGFALLATVTGIGGGTLRDLVLGVTPVFWVQQPVYIAVCVAVAAIVFFTAHIPESRYRLLLWLDAFGLSFFCVVGADKALAAGAGPFVAIVMGVITATFGGVVRDVLGGEIPVILRREIYATAALVGSGAFVAALVLGIPGVAAALLGFAACLAIRGLALQRGWSLPVYRARPGRSPDETDRR
ncbi:MAG: trimeric intracellular cation channel family protein [Pseudorhodoplanes sp.]|uniref:trimeric intracellular cation channel family protein n=1 Tax=Pseudorhodoplanes sp. TaxID=1934341 RepID=UPI003D0BF963